jgi:4a-hydroxytetrahydrobiopterin dehydratase
MSNELSSKTCIPCQGGVPPLTAEEIAPLLDELGGTWRVVDLHHLEKTFENGSFAASLDFVNRVGALAEAEGHHPDLHLSFRKVTVRIFTNKIGGLTESDFILAAKIDRLLPEPNSLT